MLNSADRLAFERLLQWLRLSFLASPALVVLAFGAEATLYAILIAVAVAASYGWTWWLLRRPEYLLRVQLALRVIDCGLVFLVIASYHVFLGNAYYDSVYLLFVLAGAATHGRFGALLLSLISGVAVLAGRFGLWSSEGAPFEVRHLTDSIFYTIFFLVVGLAVAFLMRRSAEVVEQRERAWRDAMAARNAVLEETAAARDAALAQAEQAIQIRDAVLAAASHDLKNPLTVIMATAHTLQRRVAAGSVTPERLQDRLGAIGSAAARMTAQIDEMVEASRLRAGRPLELNVQQTDLVALVREVVAAHETNASSRRILLDCGAPAVVGAWDPTRLSRVVDNLLANAIKYSPDGTTITVTIEHDQAYEEMSGNGHGADWALLRVRDEGFGIPASDLPHIFDPFYRAGNVAGRVPGTGIGLAGARAIVEQHGGNVAIESEEGKGTTVTVRLPVRTPTATA